MFGSQLRNKAHTWWTVDSCACGLQSLNESVSKRGDNPIPGQDLGGQLGTCFHRENRYPNLISGQDLEGGREPVTTERIDTSDMVGSAGEIDSLASGKPAEEMEIEPRLTRA